MTRRMRAVLPTLVAMALAAGCGNREANEAARSAAPTAAADTAAVADLTGIWTVAGFTVPAISALGAGEADRWLGRTVRLEAAGASSGADVCPEPTYTNVVVERDGFLADQYRLLRGALPALSGHRQLTVQDVGCAGQAWTTLGGRLIAAGPDTALAPWDGVFYTLVRGHDFRAVGQEPGWTLTLTQGRAIRFRYDYDAHEVTTPVPRPEIADGATVYHAVTEAHDLRVRIDPGPCLDSMSGRVYARAVTVTLDGRMFAGCGSAIE